MIQYDYLLHYYYQFKFFIYYLLLILLKARFCIVQTLLISINIKWLYFTLIILF